MTSSSNLIPVVPANSGDYDHAKNLPYSLGLEDLMRLRDEIQGEINRRVEEIAIRQREEEEKKKKEAEEIDALFAAWKPKHFDRVEGKEDERSQRHQKCPRYDSATESDSEEEDNDGGFEYPIEEVNTSEEDSDAAENKKRMERYFDWKLRRRFHHERANPKIFARTMREGEPSDDERANLRIVSRTMRDDDEELWGAASNDDDEEEDNDEITSYGDGETYPASSDSSYSAQYEEDENWSYDEGDF